jgi:hypothetical protein
MLRAKVLVRSSADPARYDYLQLRPGLLIGITGLRQDQLSVASIGVGEHYIESGRESINKYSIVPS